jgi:hypoxanthine phosphoribosyltransferase
MPITLFISHHHGDDWIVARLSRILQHCLRLAPDRVRCTSTPTGKLAPGTGITAALMRDSAQARAFVGVYSRCALRSPWVMAETGARLGVGKAVLPVVLGKENLGGPIAGRAAVCLPDELKQLVSSVAKELGLGMGKWHAPLPEDEKGLRDLINSEVKQWLVPVHFEARFPGAQDLSADVVVAAADRLRDLIGAGDFRPGLIVALNEGGMILAAGLARHYREAQIGSVFTAFTKRQKQQVRDVDQQRVALPGQTKKRKHILVLDTKLKTGESALNTVRYLRKTYRGADVRLGVVLASGGWEDGGVWKNLDAPAWPVVFQRDGVEIPTYVAYYTDCEPTRDAYHEAWRLRRKMA